MAKYGRAPSAFALWAQARLAFIDVLHGTAPLAEEMKALAVRASEGSAALADKQQRCQEALETLHSVLGEAGGDA